MLYLIIRNADYYPAPSTDDWISMHTDLDEACRAHAKLHLSHQSSVLVAIDPETATWRPMIEAHAADGAVVTSLIERGPELNAKLPQVLRDEDARFGGYPPKDDPKAHKFRKKIVLVGRRNGS